MTPAEHLASLAVAEAHLLRAIRECQLAVEAITETDDRTGGDHADAAGTIVKAALDLHRIQKSIHQEIKQ